MTCKGYTPLDVATATIKDNQELVLALEPSHLEDVVSLLVATTTDPHSETLGHENALTTVRTASVSCEWAPNGGEKCLEPSFPCCLLHCRLLVNLQHLSAGENNLLEIPAEIG